METTFLIIVKHNMTNAFVVIRIIAKMFANGTFTLSFQKLFNETTVAVTTHLNSQFAHSTSAYNGTINRPHCPVPIEMLQLL